jgi:hypothetical protein
MTATASLAPSFVTAAALAAALAHLEIVERVAARRNFDRWSTAKLNAAKNDVRLAHFHNTMGGSLMTGGFNGINESPAVTAGFAAQDALQD